MGRVGKAGGPDQNPEGKKRLTHLIIWVWWMVVSVGTETETETAAPIQQ